MNILWVENHFQFSSIVTKTFLTAHAVTIIPTVEGARQALADGTFDIVMLDYDLDDGKGVELLKEILAIANRPLVIAASSHDRGNQKLLDAGADAVCDKIGFSKIGQVIDDLVGNMDRG